MQVGFSYDTPTNFTFDLPSGNRTQADFSEGVPEQNNTFRVGTISSNQQNLTANSTIHAAHALWHFAQTWFEEFPHLKPNDEKISVWTESYGGKYGPAFTQFFQSQNYKISKGIIKGPGTHYIHLDTLGIINGCIESRIQTLAYIEMAYNNTYGIQAINQSQYNNEIYEYSRDGGLLDQIIECQTLAKTLDPFEQGNIEEVNRVCSRTMNASQSITIDPLTVEKKVSNYSFRDAHVLIINTVWLV